MLPTNVFNIFPLQSMSMISIMCLITFFFISEKPMYSSTLKKKYPQLKNNLLSIFVSFDPKTSMKIFGEMNWIIMMIFLIISLYKFWSKPSRMTSLKNSCLTFLENQFKPSLKSKKDSSTLPFLYLFMFIFLSNFMGLIPYSFTATSHLTTTMFMSLPVWLGFLMFGWFKYTNKMLVHLVPMGTPFILISIMVIIESISTLIRPMALAVRLMANLVSGHVLMTLLGNSINNSSSLIFTFILLFIQASLTSVEMGVATVQALVFSLLVTLYSAESDYSK